MTTKTHKRCRHCFEPYNIKEVKRIYGKESAVSIQEFCSAICFTKHAQGL